MAACSSSTTACRISWRQRPWLSQFLYQGTIGRGISRQEVHGRGPGVHWGLSRDLRHRLLVVSGPTGSRRLSYLIGSWAASRSLMLDKPITSSALWQRSPGPQGVGADVMVASYPPSARGCLWKPKWARFKHPTIGFLLHGASDGACKKKKSVSSFRSEKATRKK